MHHLVIRRAWRAGRCLDNYVLSELVRGDKSRDQPPHPLGKGRLVKHGAFLGPNTFVISILRSSIGLQMYQSLHTCIRYLRGTAHTAAKVQYSTASRFAHVADARVEHDW